jgi:hypothetical protein
MEEMIKVPRGLKMTIKEEASYKLCHVKKVLRCPKGVP